MNKNEYLHNTGQAFDRFRLNLRHRYMRFTVISDDDIIDTGQIQLLYCEEIRSHPYLFYIRRYVFLSILH